MAMNIKTEQREMTKERKMQLELEKLRLIHEYKAAPISRLATARNASIVEKFSVPMCTRQSPSMHFALRPSPVSSFLGRAQAFVGNGTKTLRDCVFG